MGGSRRPTQDRLKEWEIRPAEYQLQQMEGVRDAKKTMSEDEEGIRGQQMSWMLEKEGVRAQ